MDERAKTCPRCGGAVHMLRRFTRLGRTVSVLVCRVCRYTEFAAGSPAALS
jgi:predicted nucleic-acid-binding Zn-ribbon protein